MNNITNFNFEGSPVRTTLINSEPYFVGKDVADALGYINTKDALSKHVDDDDKLGSQIATSGQNRVMTLISESGLYSLVLSSKLPSAKRFKRWVTTEVLPSIRKHGAYMTSETIEQALLNPDTIISLATQLKSEREARINAENTVYKQKPKVEYFDKQMHNPGLLTTTVVARAFGKSAKWLNHWLEEHKVIYHQGKTWVAYQSFADKGYCNYENWADDGNEHVHALLKWTQKGEKLIYDLLEQEGYLPTSVTMTLDAPQRTERESND